MHTHTYTHIHTALLGMRSDLRVLDPCESCISLLSVWLQQKALQIIKKLLWNVCFLGTKYNK